MGVILPGVLGRLSVNICVLVLAAGCWQGSVGKGEGVPDAMPALDPHASADGGVDAGEAPTTRRYFVAALMKDDGVQSWVRLAQYTLTPPATVEQSFWYWSQIEFPGKVDSGRTTAGCSQSCTVYAANGFEDGNSTYPKTLSGTYEYNGTRLHINWASGSWESWDIGAELSVATRLILVETSAGGNRGWAWGSTSTLDAAVAMNEIVSGGVTYSGPYQQNNYGVSLSGTTSLSMEPFASCDSAAYHADVSKRYLAPGAGRKTFYNRQKYAVDPSACIGTGGGHLNPFLQIIDDNGAFRGWVGVEASQYAPGAGSSILAIYDLNDL